MRIVKWQYKLVFAVAAWGICKLLGQLDQAIDPSPILRAVIGGILMLAPFIVGARIFRGRDEAMEPRPWWKMTARPTLSKVLGVVFVVCTAGFTLVFGLGTVFQVRTGVETNLAESVIIDVLALVSLAILAFLYLTTYRKLKPLFPEAAESGTIAVEEPRPMWDTAGPGAGE